MFPTARYYLWVDGKLKLVVDPYQKLERFLWRKSTTFAISRHYRRFDVFVEADANKAAGKYDNATIDFQIDFYKKEGLIPYAKAKFPLTSVDRFTPRDQLSFSTVRDKITAKTNWTSDTFLDCERRNFVVQKYHRDVLENVSPPPPPPRSLPPPSIPINDPRINQTFKSSTEKAMVTSAKKLPPRQGRDRRSSRWYQKVASGDK